MSIVFVECTSVPDASTPVMEMVYAPAGVPPWPPLLTLLLPPPQATWKTKLANSTQASAASVRIFLFLFLPGPGTTRVATNPISGKQTA